MDAADYRKYATTYSTPGRTYLLGTGVEWQRKRQVARRKDTFLYSVSRTGVKATYTTQRKATEKLYSLAALLAGLRLNAFYAIEISDCQVWICQVINSRVSPESDRVYLTSSVEDAQRLKDVMLEAEQMVDPENIYHIRSPEELAELLADELPRHPGADIEKCKLNLQGGFSLKNTLSIVGLVAFLAASYGGYYLWEEKKKRDAEEARRQAELAKYEQALNNIKSQAPVDQAIGLLKGVMSQLPYNVAGYEVKTLSCTVSGCSATYGREEAALATPALDWAKTVDPKASLSKSGKEMTLRIKASVDTSAPIPLIPAAIADYAWADFIAAVDKAKPRIKVEALKNLPGSAEAGSRMQQGKWTIGQIKFGYGLALIEGLQRIPGVRFQTINVVSGTISMSGVYAIDNL